MIKRSFGLESVEEFSAQFWAEPGGHRTPCKTKPEAQRAFEYINEKSVVRAASERGELNVVPERDVIAAAPQCLPVIIDGGELGLEACRHRIRVCNIGHSGLREVVRDHSLRGVCRKLWRIFRLWVFAPAWRLQVIGERHRQGASVLFERRRLSARERARLTQIILI